MKQIEVGILGGTGMVGQHFIRFLEGHPWFKLTWLGASDRSAGKKLREATSWRLEGEMPATAAEYRVLDAFRNRRVRRGRTTLRRSANCESREMRRVFCFQRWTHP